MSNLCVGQMDVPRFCIFFVCWSPISTLPGNLQGTGVTIIKLTPTGPVAPSVAPGQNGNATTFFTSNLQGLTTALGILQGGFVVVGNLPSTLAQGSLVSHSSSSVVYVGAFISVPMGGDAREGHPPCSPIPPATGHE